jgi:hypothetical protein
MKAVLNIFAALLLVGCADTYRYPCQDPENKDKAECSRPQCEVDGFCFDTLNGLPPQQTPVEEPAAPAADCNCNTETENTGE